MKKKISLLIVILSAVLLLTSPVYAHYVWFDPSGQVTATPGETVSVDIYLHAETADIINGWGFNIGFDDVAHDGLELEYLGYTYGPRTLVDHPTDEAVGYLPEASNVNPGEGVFHAGRYDWNWRENSLGVGEDYLLFTTDFTFVDGIWDGEDVWGEWNHAYPNESYFDLDSGFYNGGFGTGLYMLVEAGPDYAPVPIPAAAWLLGSGLLGLIGIRRKIT